MKTQIKHRKKVRGSQVAIHIAIVILLFLVLYPIALLVIKSFKSINQDLLQPFWPTWPLSFDNYRFAWINVRSLFLNTIVIALVNTFGSLLVTSMLAYAFARFRFPGKNVIFMIILSMMMMPGVLTLVPKFIMVNDMNLTNKLAGVYLVEISASIPTGTLLLRTFFQGVPDGLFEAAEIDGCSHVRMYATIMIPLSASILCTLGIMNLLQSWNNLVWPQIVLSSEEKRTIATGLVPFTNTYYSQYGTYGPPLAGYVLTSLPLIIAFLFASKQFVSGLTSGAFKM